MTLIWFTVIQVLVASSQIALLLYGCLYGSRIAYTGWALFQYLLFMHHFVVVSKLGGILYSRLQRNNHYWIYLFLAILIIAVIFILSGGSSLLFSDLGYILLLAVNLSIYTKYSYNFQIREKGVILGGTAFSNFGQLYWNQILGFLVKDDGCSLKFLLNSTKKNGKYKTDYSSDKEELTVIIPILNSKATNLCVNMGKTPTLGKIDRVN